MKYMDALRKYNEGSDKWCVPRKGTDDYVKIRDMMKRTSKTSMNKNIKYKIRDWIPLLKVKKSPLLSVNPNAIDFLRANKKHIDYRQLSKNKNPKAVELLKEKPKKVDWVALSRNVADEAVALLSLKENVNNIDWDELSGNTNPNAIELLKANPENINWEVFSGNIADEAVAFLSLKENVKNIDWEVFMWKLRC